MLWPDEPEPEGDPPRPEGGESKGELGTNGDPPEPAEGELAEGCCRAAADRGCQVTRPTPKPAAIATTTSNAAAVIVRNRRVFGGGVEAAQ